jgi:SNF2 family DNA or RNA helicase
MTKVTASHFRTYAGNSLDRWSQLIGHEVHHESYGKGKVIDIRCDEKKEIAILIEFLKNGRVDRKCFGPLVMNCLSEIELPDTLAERIRKIAGDPPKPPRGQRPPIAEPPLQDPKPQSKEKQALYSVGDLVFLKVNPSRRGRVGRAIQGTNGQWNYEVFFSAEDTAILKESDLLLYAPGLVRGSLDDLLRDLAEFKLRKPLGDSLYALFASRTKFEVYQFKPALKFLANPDQRLLIADEVGLGKTIEAGIIFVELQARLGLDRVLIVCPSSLRQKWQDEMKMRFDEEFTIFDMKSAKRWLEQYRLFGNSHRLRGIISLELVRRKDLAPAFGDVQTDLVIIDEAHHCRNTSTLANAIASALTENSSAALLLTATPLQMGQADLFNLLNILSPGEFDNFNAFATRLEPNQHINRAAQILSTGNTAEALVELRKVEGMQERERFLGNPYYKEVVSILQDPYAQSQNLITAQRRLLELNTLASVFTRTRKRDIQTQVPIRTAFTLEVEFTPEEMEFYNRVIEEARAEYIQSHWSGTGSAWVTIMRERQVASCISAMINRQMRERQEVYIEDESFGSDFVNDEDEISEVDEDPIQTALLQTLTVKHKSRRRILPNFDDFLHDTKFNVFWKALNNVLDNSPQSKILIFSFFRDTVDYVKERLLQLKVNARAIHGGHHVADRYKTIEEFRENPEIRVLVSSDVGSEGLDFQFCDTIFNYDLHWNPMKVEQRIGRIDRFGQEAARVRIYNLVIKDTIE